MNFKLEYRKEFDSVPKDRLAEAYFCSLALSCSLDSITSNKNYYKIIKNIVDRYNDKDNETIWYFLILNLLEIKIKENKNFYLYETVKNMKTKYSKCGLPEDICACVENINNIMLVDGFYTSLYEGLEDEDSVLRVWTSIRDEVKESCEKYFTVKNIRKDISETTFGKEFSCSEYINYFDYLFDFLIMFFMRTFEELVSANLIDNEEEVRTYLFSTINQYAQGMFIKHSDEIENVICEALAKRELAAK